MLNFTKCLPLVLCFLVSCSVTFCQAQEGRIFLPYPDTLAIYEFNGLPLGPMANDTMIPDLSGNGLTAQVLDNDQDVMELGAGAPEFTEENLEARRVNTSSRMARIVVPDDNDAFEMDDTESFTVEAYIHHEDGADPNFTDWGILFGTWSSRVPTQPEFTMETSLFYGWGLMSRPDADPGGWAWVCSPVNADGTTNLGFNEFYSDTVFHIPVGYHYLACVCDRETQEFRLYLDGANLVSTLPLQPGWSFVTPFIPGTAEKALHARFTMLNGENDPAHPNTWNRCQTPPTGFHLDAVRVTGRALLLDEIGEAWLDIQDGAATPSAELTAVVNATTFNLVRGQCIFLDGSASSGGNITKYEWKVGEGDYVEGPADGLLQVAFDEEHPAPDGIEVKLRITTDTTQTAEGKITLFVETPAMTGRLQLHVEDQPAEEAIVSMAAGKTLSAEAILHLPWPDAALDCDGDPLPTPTFDSYRWDLDGDGTVDSTDVLPPTWTADTPGEYTVTLMVTNTLGDALTLTRPLRVVDNAGNDQVFHTTPDTILHLEFNDLDPESTLDPSGTDITADLSDNQLEMVFYDFPDGEGNADHLATVGGAPQFSDDNIAVACLGGFTGAHGIIEEDHDAFEMGASDSFTFEIYAKPGPGDCCDWASLAGTFRARWDGTDAATRYGWGIMNLPDHEYWIWHVGIGAPGDAGGEQGLATFTLTAGAYSYIACVTDRESDPQAMRLYVNGALTATRTLDPGWRFETPDGAPHSTFVLFARERQEGEFLADIIPGTTVDAIRVQEIPLSADDIQANWADILSGKGADAGAGGEGFFIRGDVNADGGHNLADAVSLLTYLFGDGETLACPDTGDANDDGTLNLADAIRILTYLFADDDDLPAPFSACGTDPTDGDTLVDCVYPQDKC